jgi:hypothetical protein
MQPGSHDRAGGRRITPTPSLLQPEQRRATTATRTDTQSVASRPTACGSVKLAAEPRPSKTPTVASPTFLT